MTPNLYYGVHRSHRTMQDVWARPRTPIEDRDAASLARHWSDGFRHGAYDRLSTEATSDPDAADFLAYGLTRFVPSPATRLEYLRREIRGQRISYSELAELADLAAHITPGDVELLQWAGVHEFPDDEEGVTA